MIFTIQAVSITFGGYPSFADYVAAADELYEMATADGYDLDPNQYYTACYNSPFELTNRRQEIWYIIDAQK